MSILDKILSKRGIKDASELSEEERKTFDEWRGILSKDELTTENIKEFCKTQCEVIEGKWSDLNLEQAKKSELIPYHTVYKTLLKVIESPKVVKEQLEKHLENLLK